MITRLLLKAGCIDLMGQLKRAFQSSADCVATLDIGDNGVVPDTTWLAEGNCSGAHYRFTASQPEGGDYVAVEHYLMPLVGTDKAHTVAKISMENFIGRPHTPRS